MTINIKLTNGSSLLELTDQEINTVDTSLALLGRGAVGYSAAVAQDLIYMLENFSSATPPNRPLIGQLWHDAQNKALKLYTGTNWRNATGITSLSARGVNGITVQGTPVVDDGNIVISLDPTEIAPGFYSHATFTVDAQGRLRGAQNGFTSQSGAIPAFYMKSQSGARVFKIEIDESGNFVRTLVS